MSGQRTRAPAAPLDEDDVQALVRHGDEAAFSRVYRAVQPGLVRYLRVFLGPDAEDAASETWAQVCRDREKFHGDADGFRAWVARIGRNRALDMLRAAARRPVSSPEAAEAAFAALPATETTEEAVLGGLSTGRAIALIRELPPDQAEAVLLRVLLDLDAAGAARVLGKRAGAVRTAAWRGLRTLQTRLEELTGPENPGEAALGDAPRDVLVGSGADGAS